MTSPATVVARRIGISLLLACVVLPRSSVAGTLYVADRDTNTVAAYNGTTGALVNASFITGLDSPWGLARDSAGNFYVANKAAGTVGKYGPDGSVINASFIEGLNDAAGVAVDGSGRLFVASDTVQTYDAATGALINDSFVTGLNSPRGMAFDGAGNLYVASALGDTIGKYNATTGAAINASLITGLSYPVNMAFDATGKLYVSSLSGLGVEVFNPTTGAIISSPLVVGLRDLWGIAFDESNNFFVSRYLDGAVAKFTASGTVVANPLATRNALGPTSLVYVGSVPEPSTLALAASASLIGAIGLVRRRSRKR